jgi:hypothetical protein
MKKVFFLCLFTGLSVYSYTQNLIWFRENGKFGFVHKTTGRITITAQFTFASQFNDGIAVAAVGNHLLSSKYGFINEKGKWLIVPQFNAAGNFSEGKARVEQNGKWGYINKKGTFIIQPQFALCYEFKEGLAQASVKNNLWGLIDSSGKFIVQPEYYNITDVFAGLSCVQKNMTDKWEILDVKMKTSIKTSFNRMYAFADSLAPARDIGNKWGFVNTSGSWAIQPAFTSASSFSEGLAAVEKDYGSWGFINKKGEWVIPPQFDRSGSFYKGLALMEKGSDIVYIDIEGNILYSFKR